MANDQYIATINEVAAIHGIESGKFKFNPDTGEIITQENQDG